MAEASSLVVRNRFDEAAASDDLFKAVMAVNIERIGLTYEQRDERFKEANRPVARLTEELERARRARRTDAARIERLKRDLKAAQKNASDAVFAQVNAAEGMGVIDDNGNLQCDFHGVRAPEAKRIFDEIVLPKLSLYNVKIITGRGVHSEDGRAVLKPLLREHARSLGLDTESIRGGPEAQGAFLVLRQRER